jgi:hypothetical protein
MAEIVYRFTGGHEPDGKPSRWHEGIPARSLTQDDLDGLEPDLRKLLDQSPIYSKVESKPDDKAPASKADDKAKE